MSSSVPGAPRLRRSAATALTNLGLTRGDMHAGEDLRPAFNNVPRAAGVTGHTTKQGNCRSCLAARLSTVV